MKKFMSLSSIFIGTIFIMYGVTKFFRMQKFGIEVSGEITQVPSDELFWYFFGYSYVYLVFLGVLECGAGLLTLIPKTRRLGTLMCAVTGANITLLDFVYNIGPVRYWALSLTLLCCTLIALEWKVYSRALKELL